MLNSIGSHFSPCCHQPSQKSLSQTFCTTNIPSASILTSQPSCSSLVYSPHRSKRDPFNCQPDYVIVVIKSYSSAHIFFMSQLACSLKIHVSMLPTRTYSHILLLVIPSLQKHRWLIPSLQSGICSSVPLPREDFLHTLSKLSLLSISQPQPSLLFLPSTHPHLT